MNNEERKRAMSFLGVAPLKTEGGWIGGEPTSEERARHEAWKQRGRDLDARMRAIPDIITPEWLSVTMTEMFAVGLRDDRADFAWSIPCWIAEGRIRDVTACCEVVAKLLDELEAA